MNDTEPNLAPPSEPDDPLPDTPGRPLRVAAARLATAPRVAALRCPLAPPDLPPPPPAVAPLDPAP